MSIYVVLSRSLHALKMGQFTLALKILVCGFRVIWLQRTRGGVINSLWSLKNWLRSAVATTNYHRQRCQAFAWFGVRHALIFIKYWFELATARPRAILAIITRQRRNGGQ